MARALNNHANISHDDSGEPLPFYMITDHAEITSDGRSKTYVRLYADDPGEGESSPLKVYAERMEDALTMSSEGVILIALARLRTR